MSKFILFIFLMVLFSSCRDQPKNAMIRKLTNQKSLIGVQNNLELNRESCILLFSNDKSYKLLNAYINCKDSELEKLKIENNSIVGCNKKLYLNQDTIKICLTIKNQGEFNPGKITLLLSKDENYFIADTSISFYVRHL